MPDSRRLLTIDDNAIVIHDVETLEARRVALDLTYPPCLDMIAVAPDGTALYYAGERVESNIWIVERER